MPKGYRSIILAAVGWLILAAADPKQPAPQPTANADNQVAHALENVAATIKKAADPGSHDKPCSKGDDKRTSDLCAQWKAADAAKQAADVALWFGILGSILGAVTLYVAVRAALYARDAAKHTETGAVEAKRSADAAHEANRPWIDIEVLSNNELVIGSDEIELGLRLKFINVGNSVATDAMPYAVLMITNASLPGSENGIAKHLVKIAFDTWRTNDRIKGRTVFGGRHFTEVVKARSLADHLQEALKDNPSSRVRLYLAVGIRYRFGDRTGTTIEEYFVDVTTSLPGSIGAGSPRKIAGSNVRLDSTFVAEAT